MEIVRRVAPENERNHPEFRRRWLSAVTRLVDLRRGGLADRRYLGYLGPRSYEWLTTALFDTDETWSIEEMIYTYVNLLRVGREDLRVPWSNVLVSMPREPHFWLTDTGAMSFMTKELDVSYSRRLPYVIGPDGREWLIIDAHGSADALTVTVNGFEVRIVAGRLAEILQEWSGWGGRNIVLTSCRGGGWVVPQRGLSRRSCVIGSAVMWSPPPGWSSTEWMVTLRSGLVLVLVVCPGWGLRRCRCRGMCSVRSVVRRRNG